MPVAPVAVIPDRSKRPVHGGSDWSSHRIALLVDPRFTGGTSTAVAAEIRALAERFDLRVVALETAMFKGRDSHLGIEAACSAGGLALEWNPKVVHADTVVVHNPSCLRFNRSLALRISCAQAFVVTHENFLRPSGADGFDVAGCLDLIDGAVACGRRRLAPVSPYNRATVEAWAARAATRWRLAPLDWFNVFDEPMRAPTPRPRDRRGRHSRPGFEKFTPIADLALQFPSKADRCVILGGDALLHERDAIPPHWDVRRFGAGEVERFFSDVDFCVYFTNAGWRESFGRAIAEAIAAGKAVITDPGTAEAFGPGVVACSGGEVDAVVAKMVDNPGLYREHVLAAQADLARYRPERFCAMVCAQIEAAEADADALV